MRRLSNKTLLVDEKIGIHELLKLSFKKKGYTVLSAADGEQAIALTALTKPDIILLDVEMSGRSGFDACIEIRRITNAPIIFISSRGQLEDKLTGLKLGGDDYITKPFDFSELTARIEANLRRYRQFSNTDYHSDDIVSYGELEIDVKRCQFVLRGKPLNLTAKEAQLLMLFVRHPNQVWSAEQLYDYVWGLESTGNIETVKVHISHLRRKLEHNPSDPQFIRTVRGFGYMFPSDTLNR
ncbi:winged helix-turn-helix domain-containing protein [Paenibacillus chungangensis]|uniref:Winged helix-turn-helix domain-containing protein n=1 Tax=Paenibacillus chungangensis TaxID=696535 RepID=A0ABW3HTN6_9BACL